MTPRKKSKSARSGGIMPKEQHRVHPTRFERVIVPEVETLITFQTAPKAVCKLHHETVKDKHLQLDADDGGLVRVYTPRHPRTRNRSNSDWKRQTKRGKGQSTR
jgi:hypothetical protein